MPTILGETYLGLVLLTQDHPYVIVALFCLAGTVMALALWDRGDGEES